VSEPYETDPVDVLMGCGVLVFVAVVIGLALAVAVDSFL
jgi:hypothetical protein